jgi:hypothetical protein
VGQFHVGDSLVGLQVGPQIAFSASGCQKEDNRRRDCKNETRLNVVEWNPTNCGQVWRIHEITEWNLESPPSFRVKSGFEKIRKRSTSRNSNAKLEAAWRGIFHFLLLTRNKGGAPGRFCQGRFRREHANSHGQVDDFITVWE